MNKKIVFSINLIVVLLVFFPINIVIENENNELKIFSTGINVIYFKTENNNNFVEDKFLFFRNIKYKDYLILNYSNYSSRFTYSKNKIQDQFNSKQAYFFYSKNNSFYNQENVFFTEKWMKEAIFNSIKFFEMYVNEFIFTNKYFLKADNFRSFHVKPNVIFINDKKDIIHEITHVIIDKNIDHETSDIWPEIISESNSVLYLKLTNHLRYLNEIELKQINYYIPPYSTDVLDFLKTFDYDIDKYSYFFNNILENFDYINDEIFNQLVKTYKEEELK
ncbi:hypothetical protein [Geotoga petraea]|uniref:Peptidase MA superfamily protein n=1 Tax=Geotoga petraea TaxID=28234 RepID=A0A1G6MW95_9BACT|nr:hypothetical protein [Geotoga petraea]TGG87335.1 hypothetical protein E4650_08505 [Geotoga petraea]SDC59225.1 hypothetical protein SAMN04488588_1392 [Geotoga petraea]